MNELEARRVQKALARLAAEVEPLSEADVAGLARTAMRTPRPSRAARSRGAAVPVGTAVAAAALLALPWVGGSERAPAETSATQGGIVQFPDGSALQRLLSAVESGGSA